MEDRRGGQGVEPPKKIFFTAPFKHYGNACFDIKICPFLDRKGHLHLLFNATFQCIKNIADLSVS